MKVQKPKIPIEVQGKINKMKMDLETEQQRSDDVEAAMVELAELYAAQEEHSADIDAALVELAELIVGGE